MKKSEGWYENFFGLEGFKDLNIYSCGKRIHNLNHSYGPAVISHFLLVYVKEGHATLHSHKDKVRLCPGDILVMLPNCEVHYCVDKNIPWSISWVGIYGSAVPQLIRQAEITEDEPVRHINNRYEVEDILEKIYNLSCSGMYSDKMAAIGQLYRLFSVLLSEKSNIAPKNYPLEVKQIIRRNFDKNISVEEIASRLNINKTYLTRIFKAEYNITIKDYLINIRMQRAKELLSGTEASVLKISNSTGYTDPLYFSRIFKKKTGLSPTEFRKKPTK